MGRCGLPYIKAELPLKGDLAFLMRKEGDKKDSDNLIIICLFASIAFFRFPASGTNVVGISDTDTLIQRRGSIPRSCGCSDARVKPLFVIRLAAPFILQ